MKKILRTQYVLNRLLYIYMFFVVGLSFLGISGLYYWAYSEFEDVSSMLTKLGLASGFSFTISLINFWLYKSDVKLLHASDSRYMNVRESKSLNVVTYHFNSSGGGSDDCGD